MNRIVTFFAFVMLTIMIAVPVAAATVVPVFGFLGLDSLTDVVGSLAGILITAIGIPYLRRYVNSSKRVAQADEWDRVADGIVGAIRLNNPGNKIVDMVDSIQNQVFDQLKANPEVTNSESVIRRIASAAVVRALDAANESISGKK